ncbi:MAG: glycoside hydrolase family 5 protein [Sedimentisphaerales bacterium]
MIRNIDEMSCSDCAAKGVHGKSGLAAIVFMLLFAVVPLYAVPPLLHVDRNKIKDPNGNIVVLRGVAMIDLGSTELWWGGAINTIDRLTNQNDATGDSPGWYTKIIRVPICPNDSPLCTNSPLTFNPRNPNEPNNPRTRDLLRTVVDYCASKDVYVIIDYHHMANTYDEVAEVNAFWSYMAPEFANDSHVLFELFNEPINLSGSPETDRWLSVKDDMETWIATVRASAPHNIILVGTPSYCQILAPVVGNPVADSNAVYVAHTYPCHWLGRAGHAQSWFTNHIATCAGEYPVIMTEWGFTTDPKFDATFYNGTISNYGRPLKAFLEQYGIGNTAWCASNSVWGSPIFYRDWTLRCGEGEMGCFTKDWLYEKSGVEQTAALTITKCKVTAGKTQGQDSDDISNIKDAFDASGTFASSPVILSSVTQIDVNIVSADGNIIYSESVDYNTSLIANGKYGFTHKLTKGQAGYINSLKIDFNKKTFAVKAQNINLTGLACSLRLDLAFGNYIMSGEANEAVVNGKKTLIPTRLMRLYKDTLVVNKAKAKHNSGKVFSDTLSVTGDIAVIDTDVNLCNYDVNFVWGNQLFNVAPGKFKASKTGHLYKCTKDANDANGDPGVVTAQVDIDKATFTLSVNKANGLDASSASIPFGISFADFNEIADVCRVTGRSWSY